MRALHITLPLGLLLAAAGTGMMALSMRPAPDSTGILMQPRHPVTPEMWKHAEGMAGVLAPEFTLTDTNGKSQTLASLTKDKPLLLYFILDGCPCSIDAEPLLQRLHKHHQGNVNFLGVINGKPEVGKKWATDWISPYPVAPSPNLKVMKDYAVERSVYSLLIDREGKIVRMWPGYSEAMLTEANALMAKLTGNPEKPFDALYAPKEIASGCRFDGGEG